MASLTIVGFASGSPLSQMALARLARDHRLAAIVAPPRREGVLRKLARALLRRKNPLAAFGVPLIDAAEVGRFKPDVIVVASFPRIIAASVLATARIGALNMHASALPRHRGVDGIFGTYWDDDREAAMSIHWINERIDAGDIAAQKSIPLERGRPSRELYMELASIGVELLAGVLEEVAAGQTPRSRQDESHASYQSAADIARARIPFAESQAERVWHVLSGLGDQRTGLVADAAGQPLIHGRATSYRLASNIEPGCVSVADAGYELHCRDGIVALSGTPQLTVGLARSTTDGHVGLRRRKPQKGIMVSIGRVAKVAVGGIVVLGLALVAYARFGTTPLPGPRALRVVAPGVYTSPPEGIAAVRGECTGRLTLTPAASHYLSAMTFPYPVVYDCAAKTFTVLKSLPVLIFASDLTLTKEGYYLHLSRFVDGIETGSYFFYDSDGRQIREVTQPADPKVHDLIVGDHDATMIQYAPDWDSAGCGVPAALDIEIIDKDFDGKVLWKWSSKGHLNVDQRVSTDASMHAPAERRWRKAFEWLRHCYTSIARRLVKFDVPKGLLFANGGTVFALQENDYVHVNSIQQLEPSGDILVSARHLDTIFIVDRKTGDIRWSLGGKYSMVAKTRPIGDPRGGFSHQHYARIAGKRLFVFDNGNLFPDLPSRAVVYQMDSESSNRMIFEFPEPNGKQRYSLGSVQLLEGNQLLIGWGAVNETDMDKPQRAVSIVNMADGKEVFSIDMAPSWLTYRVKAVQP